MGDYGYVFRPGELHPLGYGCIAAVGYAIYDVDYQLRGDVVHVQAGDEVGAFLSTFFSSPGRVVFGVDYYSQQDDVIQNLDYVVSSELFDRFDFVEWGEECVEWIEAAYERGELSEA